jgi:hypothetical protein
VPEGPEVASFVEEDATRVTSTIVAALSSGDAAKSSAWRPILDLFLTAVESFGCGYREIWEPAEERGTRSVGEYPRLPTAIVDQIKS